MKQKYAAPLRKMQEQLYGSKVLPFDPILIPRPKDCKNDNDYRLYIRRRENKWLI